MVFFIGLVWLGPQRCWNSWLPSWCSPWAPSVWTWMQLNISQESKQLLKKNRVQVFIFVWGFMYEMLMVLFKIPHYDPLMVPWYLRLLMHGQGMDTVSHPSRSSSIPWWTFCLCQGTLMEHLVWRGCIFTGPSVMILNLDCGRLLLNLPSMAYSLNPITLCMHI